MAKAVIHLLEVIDIENGDGARMAVRPLGEGVAQAEAVEHPVSASCVASRRSSVCFSAKQMSSIPSGN